MLGVVGSKLCLPTSLRPFERGARDGAVVRALASHQCGPGSNPGVDAIMWVEFPPRSFSAGTPLFPFPQKPTSPNSNSTRNQVDEELLCRCVIYKSLLFFILLKYFFIEHFAQLFQWLAILCSVLRHSAVHSTIVLLPLVWLRWRREKCKNRSVFWVSEYEWKKLFTHGTWIK